MTDPEDEADTPSATEEVPDDPPAKIVPTEPAHRSGAETIRQAAEHAKQDPLLSIITESKADPLTRALGVPASRAEEVITGIKSRYEFANRAAMFGTSPGLQDAISRALKIQEIGRGLTKTSALQETIDKISSASRFNFTVESELSARLRAISANLQLATGSLSAFSRSQHWAEAIIAARSPNLTAMLGATSIASRDIEAVSGVARRLRRTAQLKVDLAHKGPAGFFSWPSLGSGAGYTFDEAAIEGSEPAMQNFLVDFAERSGANAVHIIAHSMGNRGLLRAMDAIAKAAAAAAPVRFGQVFLAAPDVDAQLFRNLAVAYGHLSARATLYVTNNDKAIGLSRRFHGFDRAGLAPPIAIVPGIDTIDASHVNLGLLGHGYAAEMRPVLADMHQLIRGNTAPDQRFGLRRALRGKASHWEFIP